MTNETRDGRALMLLRELRKCFRADGAAQIIPFSLIATIDAEFGSGLPDHASSPLTDEVLSKLDERADNFSVKAATVIRRIRLEHRSQAFEVQSLSERNAVLEGALQDVLNPIGYLRRLAAAEGNVLGNMAYSVANDPGLVKSIARAALAKLPASPAVEDTAK